ncbi:MAG: hypothetical protein ACRDZU_11760 [Acidimicrobiales bacterium]
MIAIPRAEALPQLGGDTVGYVGCSNTSRAIDGYHALGGTRMWEGIHAYGSGTIEAWSDFESSYWSAFSRAQARRPAKVFWLQLCAYADTSDATNEAAATAVIAHIKALAPGAVIYVSPINGYVAHVCAQLGANGADRLKALADSLAASGIAQRGPDVGDITVAETERDGCHQNAAGKLHNGLGLTLFSPFS